MSFLAGKSRDPKRKLELGRWRCGTRRKIIAPLTFLKTEQEKNLSSPEEMGGGNLVTNFSDYLQGKGTLLQACVCLLISCCRLLRGSVTVQLVFLSSHGAHRHSLREGSRWYGVPPACSVVPINCPVANLHEILGVGCKVLDRVSSDLGPATSSFLGQVVEG